MATSPNIHTKRLVITSFQENHLTERYISWMNNDALMLYSRHRGKTQTMETCREYWLSFQGTANYFWAIEEKQLGHIGNINAHIDSPSREANIGLIIGENQAQNHGYGLEAWLGIIQFLFDHAGIIKVIAGTRIDNKPMLRLMTKAAMVEESIEYRRYPQEASTIKVINKALLKKQFY